MRHKPLSINVDRARWKFLWRLIRIAVDPRYEILDVDSPGDTAITYGEIHMAAWCYNQRNFPELTIGERFQEYRFRKRIEQIALAIDAKTLQLTEIKR